MRGLLMIVVVSGCTGEEWDGVHRLSCEPLFDDIANKVVSSEAREISPRYPLWSDGAAKQRWVVLPEGGEIDTSDMDHWQVPVGTKLFKEFRQGERRVETRMIERVSEDEYKFVPYVWLADQSDALATPEGASVDGYAVPAAGDCMMCHGSEKGRVLGLSAIQLSGAELPLSRRPDRNYEISEPALGVLHANCGHCHNENGVAPMQTLRFGVADAELPIEQTAPYMTTVGKHLSSWRGQGFDYRILSGDLVNSAIYYRMTRRGDADQMPPLGSDVVDDKGVEIVRDWIISLSPAAR